MTPDASLVSLIAAAKEAARASYSPYSKFTVGAAVEAEGQVYTGTNVENASYGLTICAERVAIFKMVSSGVRTARRVVVYTPTATPTPPCGACRQVLNEFADDLEVISVCDSEVVERTTLAALLPKAFGPRNLT